MRSMRPVDHRRSDAILGAMRQVALAGGHALTHADTASILAAGALPAAPARRHRHRQPARRRARRSRRGAEGDRELAREAVKYLAIMAMVDGSLDTRQARSACWTMPARSMSRPTTSPISSRRPRAICLGHRRHVAQELRQRHQPLLARASIRRRGSGPMTGPTPIPRWSPATRRWASCRRTPSARRCGTSTRRTAIPFRATRRRSTPRFGTPHDSTHVISGYDTSCARRAPRLDLHRRHASDQSDGGPHPAGDLLLSLRRAAQRRRSRRQGRPRSRRVLARLGARPRHDGRHLRARLECLGLDRARPRGAAARLERRAGRGTLQPPCEPGRAVRRGSLRIDRQLDRRPGRRLDPDRHRTSPSASAPLPVS